MNIKGKTNPIYIYKLALKEGRDSNGKGGFLFLCYPQGLAHKSKGIRLGKWPFVVL